MVFLELSLVQETETPWENDEICSVVTLTLTII